MALTGLLMLWATTLAGEASAGVRVAFLTLAVGQAAATPVAGFFADVAGLPATFAGAAAVSLGLLVVPRTRARAVPTRVP